MPATVALRTRWLALVVAFLWGALGSVQPEALRRPASADAQLAPPWIVLAPRRVTVEHASTPRGLVSPDPGAGTLEAGILIEIAAPRPVVERAWHDREWLVSDRVGTRARGPPRTFAI
jgi:hypothetical protein